MHEHFCKDKIEEIHTALTSAARRGENFIFTLVSESNLSYIATHFLNGGYEVEEIYTNARRQVKIKIYF